MEILRYVVENTPTGAASLDRPRVDGATPCYFAAARGHMEVLRYIVENSPKGAENLEIPLRNGITPAAAAAEYGKVDVLRYLVEHAPSGRQALVKASRQGHTPALLAVRKYRLEVLRFLYENAPTSGDEILTDDVVVAALDGLDSSVARNESTRNQDQRAAVLAFVISRLPQAAVTRLVIPKLKRSPLMQKRLSAPLLFHEVETVEDFIQALTAPPPGTSTPSPDVAPPSPVPTLASVVLSVVMQHTALLHRRQVEAIKLADRQPESSALSDTDSEEEW